MVGQVSRLPEILAAISTTTIEAATFLPPLKDPVGNLIPCHAGRPVDPIYTEEYSGDNMTFHHTS